MLIPMQDVLEMRANNWRSRTKEEGPKAIADVHKDAEREAREVEMRNRREDSDRRGGYGGRGGRGGGDRYGGGGDRGGGGVGPPPQDARIMSRDEVPTRVMHAMARTGSSEVSLRPQASSMGAFGRMGGKGAPPPPAGRSGMGVGGREAALPSPSSPTKVLPAAGGSADAGPSSSSTAAAAGSVSPPPPKAAVAAAASSAAAGAKGLSAEDTRKRAINLVKDGYALNNAQDMVERLCGLKAEGGPMAVAVDAAVREALEVRGVDMSSRLVLLTDVLSRACNAQEAGALSKEDLEAGFGALLGSMHVLAEDNPKAPGVVAVCVGKLAGAGLCGLGPLLQAVQSAQGEEEAEEGEG